MAEAVNVDLRHHRTSRAAHHGPALRRFVDREGTGAASVAGVIGIGARVSGAMTGLPTRVAALRSPLPTDVDRFVRS